jgi:hypothetical protein
MARKYSIGDTVRLTRKVSVDHFSSVGMSITGKIVETRDTGRYEYLKGPRNYGIEFTDRPGAWWYAGWEFKRV